MAYLRRLLLLLVVLSVHASAAWGAKYIRLLGNDIEAKQARVDVILGAIHNLKLQYFIFGKDGTSLVGAALMRDAALRGTTTQLIVDAQFNSLPEPVLAYLVSVGVQIKVFHPWKWSEPLRIFRRMHDKGASGDGRVMIRGGRNVENSYLGLSEGRNYVDLDVMVIDEEDATNPSGSIVDSDIYFNQLFASKHVEPIKVKMTPALIAEGKRMLDEAYQRALDEGLLNLKSGVDWRQNGIRVEDDKVRFLYDPVGDKNGGNGIAQKLRDIFLEAKETVYISSPYFVPTEEFMEHVKTMRQQKPNVDIVVLTNSVVSTDGVLPQGGYLRYRQQLLDLGIRIFEYKGPGSLHAKAMVTGNRAVISSFNLDPRSQFLNTEIAVDIEDAQVAEQLRHYILDLMKNAWEIGPNGMPLNGENPMSLLTRKQKMILRAARCASYFIKGQL